MIKLIDILKEAKQVGILYHYCQFSDLYPIIKSNLLKASETTDFDDDSINNPQTKCISLTRSKNKDQFLISYESDCALVLDGDKLSNNYKISPHHDPNQLNYGDEEHDEMEERICGKDIKDLNNYIIKIIFYKESIEGSSQNEKEFKKCLSLITKNNIPYEIV
jgi:hypothetical protein